nr:hypothetical protein [Tanacetum cinerariifolium]
MGLRSCATWDRDSITWGGWDKGVGTILMGASVRECRVREVEFRQENRLGNCWGLLWGLVKWQKESLGFVKAGIPEANTPPRNRVLATPRPGCEVGESFAAAARRQGPAMAHGVDCRYMETRLQDTERRMMAALELVNRRVSYQVEVCTRESSESCTRHHDAQKDRAAVRAEIEVLRNERLAYEQKGIQTREALARSEAHCRALEA